jgi:hypothetical protein
MRADDVRFWRAVYDEKLTRLDARLGEFLDEFGRLGLMDDTLVVVTSDHGTELFERGRIDHGFALYDEHLRVPLVLKLPGDEGGRVVRERVGLHRSDADGVRSVRGPGPRRRWPRAGSAWRRPSAVPRPAATASRRPTTGSSPTSGRSSRPTAGS